MADGAVHAERLARSAEDPKHPGRDCSEEDEVEASYKENFAGNAQAAVDEFMSNMGFLEREGDLVYVIPKGTERNTQTFVLHATFTRIARLRCQNEKGAQAQVSLHRQQTHANIVVFRCSVEHPSAHVRLSGTCSTAAGHVQGMNVPAKFYASPELLKLVSNEFRTASGGFTGAVQQLANVATLPGALQMLSALLLHGSINKRMSLVDLKEFESVGCCLTVYKFNITKPVGMPPLSLSGCQSVPLNSTLLPFV